MFDLILVPLAIDSASSALTEFISLFGTVWTFITGNWYFTALIIIPLGALIVGSVLGFMRR